MNSETDARSDPPALGEDLGGSEELVRLLLNSTGEGIYGIDLEGACTFANPACLKLLGIQGDGELLGRNMHVLVHHTRANGAPYPVEECRIYRAFRECEGTHVDDEVMWCADGSSFPAEYWSYPVEREGELVGCVVTFVDVSERERAEGDLRQAEELVRLLLNSTGEGIYGIDLEGACTFANPACLKLLGIQGDGELLGRNMHVLVHHTRANGAPYPVEECRIYRAFRECEGTHVDDEVMWCADGSSFPAEYWSYPVEREGELVGCVVTFVDVSERKRAEEDLRQAEKLAALGKLSAGLAHELNNPAAAAQRSAAQLQARLEELERLAVRLGGLGLDDAQWARLCDTSAQILAAAAGRHGLSPLERADGEDAVADWLSANGIDEGWALAPALAAAGMERLEAVGSELPAAALQDALAWVSQSVGARELVETIAVSTTSISELVGAVKSYSSMDRAREQEVDVHEGLESTLRILAHKLKAGTELVRAYDRSLPSLFVPAGELNQVWTNLIDNAIDAAGPEGQVRVRTFRSDDWVVVEIGDNGGGIAPEIQPRIFDLFFTTKEVGMGSGLGLDVARRIIGDRCHGEIGFRSEPGDTRFWVRLPLMRTPAAGAEEPADRGGG